MKMVLVVGERCSGVAWWQSGMVARWWNGAICDGTTQTAAPQLQ